MARTGRPKKPLNMRKVATLSKRGWTLRDIASLFNVAHTTIMRRLAKAQTEPTRTPIQEVLVIRTPTCTKYIVVGKRIHVERHAEKAMSF